MAGPDQKSGSSRISVRGPDFGTDFRSGYFLIRSVVRIIRTGADFFCGPVRVPERKFEFFFKNFSFGLKTKIKKIVGRKIRTGSVKFVRHGYGPDLNNNTMVALAENLDRKSMRKTDTFSRKYGYPKCLTFKHTTEPWYGYVVWIFWYGLFFIFELKEY